MTANTDDADAKAILGLMNLPRVGPAAIHRILDALARQDTAPGLLLDYDAAGLVDEELLSEQQATLFTSVEQRDWRSGVMAHLEMAVVRPIPVTSVAYPPHLRHTLGSKSPPILMARGNTDLLLLGGIAFAGARRATEGGLEITRTLVARAVEQAFTVISGGAAGADATSHDEAIARGGSTIVVLAEGICTPRARDVDALLETGRAVVVSTFRPLDPWQAWRAMERNRYILGLCDRLVVIEAGERGGTLAAGREALEAEVPTWVLDFADPPASASGNLLLMEEGARSIPVTQSGDLTIPPELFAIEGWTVERVQG